MHLKLSCSVWQQHSFFPKKPYSSINESRKLGFSSFSNTIIVMEGVDDKYMDLEYRRKMIRETSLLSKEHVSYVDYFLEHAFGREENVLCPCKRCMHRERIKVRDDVRLHLIRFGFDPSYDVWTFHGESNIPKANDEKVEGKGKSRMETFFDNVVRDFEDQPEVLATFLGEKDNPLYDGCKKEDTVISCLMEVFNMKAASGWSDVSVNRLLMFLHDKLPEGNGLPKTLYEAKKLLCPFELEYEKIHACPNDCVLFRGETLKDALACPVCKASRYEKKKKRNGEIMEELEDEVVVGKKNRVPAKCIWYLPIFPRFERMFANMEDSKNLTWHRDRVTPNDDVIRHPADGDQWKKVDRMYPTFGNDARNLRLGISTDGMNPFGNMSSKHSSWPVMLVIYNLPPYLCMKRKYVMMPLMISGPKQPGNDIDVFLAPLIEDLKRLWIDGIVVKDALTNEPFNLKGILFWSVTDFPGLGNLSGYVAKGHKACPICEEGTDFKQLKFGKKTVYMGHRKFLRCNHPYRLDKDGLFGGKEDRLAPKILSGKNIHMKMKKLNVVLGKKGKKGRVNEKSPWKKRSIFFDLPYWEEFDVRHCLDVMHIEKNVCDSLLGTLLNIQTKTKDTYNARRDMVEMGVRPELGPEQRGSRMYLPPGACNLSKAEKKSVCDSLVNMKVPIGYSSNISRCVKNDLKLSGLKSHDCHVLMQQLLPVALRGVLDERVRFCITRLCFFFHTICRKSLSRGLLDKIEVEAMEILSELELYFPPAFFDIMVHLIVHLVREIRICGPVGSHWMYPFERHMGNFKGYAKCGSRPDASIVERYVTEEVIEYCSSAFENPVSFGVPRNKHFGRKLGIPRSKGKLCNPYFIELKRAHQYVLRNSSETVAYVDEHLAYLSTLHPNWHPHRVQQEHNETFGDWFYSRCNVEGMDENLRAFARKPDCSVRCYTGYDINGFSFTTLKKDSKSTTQSSGVFIESEQMIDGVIEFLPFYGAIEEIWDLDYVAFKVVVFKCKWVDSRRGVDMTDEMGFTRVDLNTVGYEDDQFILASQARQIFFVDDPTDPKWSIVLQGKKYFFEDEIDCQVVDAKLEFPSAFPTLSNNTRRVGVRRDHNDGFWVDDKGFIIDDGEGKKKKQRID